MSALCPQVVRASCPQSVRVFPHRVRKLSAPCPHFLHTLSTSCPRDFHTASASCPHRVRALSADLHTDTCCARHTAVTNYAHTRTRTLWTRCALALTTIVYVNRTVFANHNVCGQTCFGDPNACGQTCFRGPNVCGQSCFGNHNVCGQTVLW